MPHTEKCDTDHPSRAVVIVVNHNRSNNKSTTTCSGDKAPLAAQIADHVPPSTHDVTLESSCMLIQSGFQLQDIVEYKPAISAQQGHSRLLQQSRNGSVTSECWVSVWRCFLEYSIRNEGERILDLRKGVLLAKVRARLLRILSMCSAWLLYHSVYPSRVIPGPKMTVVGSKLASVEPTKCILRGSQDR